MRIPLIASLMAAMVLPTIPAAASAAAPFVQDHRRDDHRSDRNDRRTDRNERRWDNRRDNDRRDDRRRVTQNQRDWRQYRNYDYNRQERGQGRYYADRYYRAGSTYQPRYLSRNDRLYRGSNGRYYCRRSDGTTGLIIGGLAGGVLGNILTNGDSQLLGTLIGGGGGALLGRSLDRREVVCR
jgi:Ni/Co efflux regulator RcnB